MPDFGEILKVAVEQQDWQLICGLYTNITGELLSVPPPAVEEKEEEKGDVLTKEYSLEELKSQNQSSPPEQDEELINKGVDRPPSSRYNDFTAPPRESSSTDFSGRQMRSEAVGSRQLTNVVGVNEASFVDDMTESLTDPETGEKLIGNNQNAQITPRNRRKQLGMNDTSLIDAKCATCSKTFKLSPSIAFGYSESDTDNTWKCNACSVRGGRRGRGR